MNPTQLSHGDVVQITPESESAFAGCFMLVTEPKVWGAQGFIAMPLERGKLPGSAYYRAKFEDIEFVGRATWAPPKDADE
jgi:hypothetical protein